MADHDAVIPLFRPSCTDLEVKYVTETLRSGWWAQGPRVEELEEKFAAYTGARHAVAVSSGTAALQLSIEAIGIKGKEIILPALTFASDALAVMHSGNIPVFADIDEDTLCIDWEDARRKTTPRTGAVIPVWYGGTVRKPRYSGTAEESADWWVDIPVIEDCAHAAGSAQAGRDETACWSFQAVKNLAAGDGGMITTLDSRVAQKARKLRWCGIDRSTWDRDRKKSYNWDYDITVPGHKAHMNDITASVALAQLERLDEMNEKRRDIVSRYLGELDYLDWLKLPEWRENSAWHIFAIRVNHRDELIDHMKSLGVSAGVHYRPLNHYEIFGKTELPVADRVWKTLLTLPLYPDMTEMDICRVISAVRSFR